MRRAKGAQRRMAMRYTRVYETYANGARQLVGYRAENGAYIECEYRSGGCAMRTKPDWYCAVNDRGELHAYDTLREAKQVVETGKSDMDLFKD